MKSEKGFGMGGSKGDDGPVNETSGGSFEVRTDDLTEDPIERTTPPIEQTAPPIEGTAPPIETGTGAPERLDSAREQKLKSLSERLAKVSADMQGAALEAQSMVPQGDLVDPAELELRKKADEARELAYKAEEARREGLLKAIEVTDVDDSATRLRGAMLYIKSWPSNASDLERIGMDPEQLAVAGLRLSKEDPERFVQALGYSEMGLRKEELFAIAERFRDTSPAAFPGAVEAMRFTTEQVRELLRGVDEETRNKVLEEINVPVTSERLSGQEMADMEWREMKDERVQRFEAMGNAISLELMSAFPDQVERQREAMAAEAELRQGIISVRDLGKTATAPMVVALEGRTMPAIYKSVGREKQAEERNLEQQKTELKNEIAKAKAKGDKARVEQLSQVEPHYSRPGVEPGSSSSREWLAYQIDKALQFDVVPATVIRSGPDGRGSLQDWRVSEEPLDSMGWMRRVGTDERFTSELAKIALFDLISENADRHSGNLKEGPDGKLIAIDNGLIAPKPLSQLDHVRSYPLWALQGKEIPPQLKEAVAKVKGAPGVMKALKECFSVALGKDGERAWKAFESRLDQVVEREAFPTDEELAEEGGNWHEFDKNRREWFARAAA